MSQFQIASGPKRVFAYLIDFGIILTFYYLCIALGSKVFPEELYPPLKPMQLYGQREFHIFWMATGIVGVFIHLYPLVTYALFKTTIGNRLMGLYIGLVDGTPVGFKKTYYRSLLSVLKLLAFIIPGPFVAIFFKGFPFQVSLGLLLIAAMFMIGNPFTSYFTQNKESWVEKLTKTRVFQTKAL